MTDKIRTDLKPCPFCGSPARYSEFQDGFQFSDGKLLCDVGCSNSHCLPFPYICEIPPEEAIPAWETRNQDDRLEERAAIVAFLAKKGITEHQAQSKNGWWDTSTGAQYGSSVLEAIKAGEHLK